MKQNSKPRITADNGMLVFTSPYDAALVTGMKITIPATERKWDPARKAWLVAPQHAETLAKLCALHLGEDVQLPIMQNSAPTVEMRVLDVRYIGMTKARTGDDDRSAFAFCDGSWSAILPERVLLEWFTGLPEQAESPTLYGILGITRQAAQDEIKTAFRRLARQWHPDVCREPGASEMFIRIREAYEILSNVNLRARYDAGLVLEASIKDADLDLSQSFAGYRSPLRCGYVLAEGLQVLGRFLVKKILSWEDITNPAGETLVTSWPAGATTFTEQWI